MGGQTIHADAEAPGLDAGWALLPAESPLQMPEQTLRAGELKVRRHRTSPRLIGLRRFYIFGGTLAMTAIATRMMWRGVGATGATGAAGRGAGGLGAVCRLEGMPQMSHTAAAPDA